MKDCYQNACALSRITQRWDAGKEPTFEDYAALLTLAKVIKQQSAELALQEPKGHSRKVLMRMHKMAVRIEKDARDRLTSAGAYPAPGGVA